MADEEPHPEKNPVLRLFRRFVRLTPEYLGTRFFVRQSGVLYATPLLMVLVVIEATDVVFAVDSIPAVFGVTGDVFIVYTSNIFAVLGLRALCFLIASVMRRLTYLRPALALVLAFVGAKMLLSGRLQERELDLAGRHRRAHRRRRRNLAAGEPQESVVVFLGNWATACAGRRAQNGGGSGRAGPRAADPGARSRAARARSLPDRCTRR